MKSSNFLFISAVMLLYACHTDDSLYPDLNAMDIPSTVSQPISVVPENNVNPYDSIGKWFLHIPYLNPKDTGTLKPYATEFTGKSDISFAAGENSWQTLEHLIVNSPLTDKAKTSWLEAIETIVDISRNPYETLYDYLVRYESVVIHHPDFSAEDKRVILSFSSLIRHVFFQDATNKTTGEGDEPDDDWDNTVADMIRLARIVLEDPVSTASFSGKKLLPDE